MLHTWRGTLQLSPYFYPRHNKVSLVSAARFTKGKSAGFLKSCQVSKSRDLSLDLVDGFEI